MPKLYIVGTPIGNLGDITERAVETLRKADLIVCEDTRVTKKLLTHLSINKPMESFHAQSGPSKLKNILDRIEALEGVAYMTDSGTPGISDPGALLVREARKRKIPIVPIPGPSALTAALSVSGISDREFTFLGFLPHKKGRETLFKQMAQSEYPIVFYESPHRLMKTLESLEKFCSSKNVLVCKELTKIYEETILGSTAEVLSFFKTNPDKVRGEFVIIIK